MAYSGQGGVTQLPAEMLFQAAGIEFLYGPCKGEADSLSDVIAQRTVAAHCYGPPAVPQVRAGRLRARAYAATQRSTALPEVLTFAESGFRSVEFHIKMLLLLLLLLLVPAKLAPKVVERLSAALRGGDCRSARSTSGHRA
jgi:tripartite-type tricarboxylate transporter receptor subunit TctC